MIFRRRDCEGCREIAELRRLAQGRATEIRRLQREIESRGRQDRTASDEGSAARAGSAGSRLFETPSIADIPIVKTGA